MNNPLMRLGAWLGAGKSPQQILELMARDNPQARRMLENLRGKNPEELRRMAENMARERGTTLEIVARSLGIQIPSGK